MSSFLSGRLKSLEPYTPGEQPQDMQYVKLNTNENPFPPSEKAAMFALQHTRRLNLYPDPDCRELTLELARTLNVPQQQVLLGNGSDELLSFAFLAFCDERRPAAFADITYGFYPVFARLYGLPYKVIPLGEGLDVNVADYLGIGHTIFLANPNAPTGTALPPAEIERIAAANPNNVVVVDEAYVDFGAESCVQLAAKLENLLVVQTFSKSRSMAGARLGFCVGSRELIGCLNAIKYSINPYNVNSMTMAMGLGVLKDPEYTQKNCEAICKTRAYTAEQLEKLGFYVLDSKANFLFATTGKIGGKELYLELKNRGVLVRHFEKKRICQYIRITIGTMEQMDTLLNTIRAILEENI